MRAGRAMHQIDRDVAAQKHLALVLQAGEESITQRFHTTDRRRSQEQTEEEDAKARKTAAQLAPGKAQGQPQFRHSPRSFRPPCPTSGRSVWPATLHASPKTGSCRARH